MAAPKGVDEELFTFKFDPRFIVIKNYKKFEDGLMVTYGYSILMNPDGTESERTEPEKISSVGYDNGFPFTESDYKKITGAR